MLSSVEQGSNSFWGGIHRVEREEEEFSVDDLCNQAVDTSGRKLLRL